MTAASVVDPAAAADEACALELLPGKQDVVDLVLAPRCARIMDESCAGPDP
jgi:hypothetical protein